MKKNVFSVHATIKSQYRIIYFVKWDRETQLNVIYFDQPAILKLLKYFNFAH